MFEAFLTSAQLTQLQAFHDFFTHENQTGFLSSIRDEKDIFSKHYADCFIAGKMLSEKGYLPSPLVDLGSGGGFPGIPLKIQFPEHEIILAECRKSKARFLQDAIQRVGLHKISVFDKKVTASNFKVPYRSLMTRALEPICETLERFVGQSGEGTMFIFMKGPDVEKELVAFRKNKKLSSQFVLKDHLTYVLPDLGHQRTLIVFKKGLS